MSDMGFLRDEETYRASTRVGTMGFSLTKRLSGGDQLQHWIFKKAPDSELGSFDLAANQEKLDLATWKRCVTTPLPSGATWGASPRQGLWIPDGTLYVVAQARRGSGSITALPSPVFPRSALIEKQGVRAPSVGPAPSRRRASAGLMQLDIDRATLQGCIDRQVEALGPSGPRSAALSSPTPSIRLGGPNEQIDVGDCQLFIGDLVVGRVFGTDSLRRPEGSMFWESAEYWVFYADRLRRAGAGALGVRDISDPVTTLSEFQRRVQAETSETERLLFMVVGCNNYQGREPPAEWFLG